MGPRRQGDPQRRRGGAHDRDSCAAGAPAGHGRPQPGVGDPPWPADRARWVLAARRCPAVPAVHVRTGFRRADHRAVRAGSAEVRRLGRRLGGDSGRRTSGRVGRRLRSRPGGVGRRDVVAAHRAMGVGRLGSVVVVGLVSGGGSRRSRRRACRPDHRCPRCGAALPGDRPDRVAAEEAAARRHVRRRRRDRAAPVGARRMGAALARRCRRPTPSGPEHGVRTRRGGRRQHRRRADVAVGCRPRHRLVRVPRGNAGCRRSRRGPAGDRCRQPDPADPPRGGRRRDRRGGVLLARRTEPRRPRQRARHGPGHRTPAGAPRCRDPRPARPDRRQRASAPIGSQAGSTIGSWFNACCRSAGSRSRCAATSNTYSSNHESFIV